MKMKKIVKFEFSIYVFEPPLVDLGATYDDHHWKARSGLPGLVLLGVMAEVL